MASSAGMGMVRMTRSVVICILALENQRPGLLKQNPGMESSQNFATGMQFKNALMTAHVPYKPRIVIMIQQMTRMRCVGNTRKYCIRMEALAQRTAAL